MRSPALDGNLVDLTADGPGVSTDKLVFTLSESTGNVWTAKTEGQR